jgi:NAD(P)-dependent dehydrogenase (short-subunit alcohol dehydrogenase family)
MAAGMFDLKRRVALITGSARGIGRAIAEGLAAHGAAVAIHDLAANAQADEAVSACESLGVRSAFFAADFADEAAVRGLIPAVAATLGAPDILVLNASVEFRENWLSVDPVLFDLQTQVNFRATLTLLQTAAPAMVERGWGRLVAIGSVQEERPLPDLMVYASLKSAQTNMMRNLAKQLGGRGVTSNVIAPGAMLTDRNRHVLSDPERRRAVEAIVPVGRLGTAEDCVGACVLLCSDAASYINGATIAVDGGWRAS